MHSTCFVRGSMALAAVAFLGHGALAQNPDRGYSVGQLLNLANIGAFALDSYVDASGHTILYAGDFRAGDSVWRITAGTPPVVTLVASGFGSGSLSIGDLVTDQQRHLVYVHDASHGAIYEINPTATPVRIRAIASDPQWVTAFGNGGIDLSPVDGNLYLLTPGNSPTGGGGIYKIDLATGTFPVTRLVPNIAAQFTALGGDVRPDVIHFDCRGRLWGSARDLADLTNRPSILYRITPPFTAGSAIQVVMVNANVGTVADLEFDPMTADIFLAATERQAILRFNTDWYDFDGTISLVDVVSSFGSKCQGIAIGPCWGDRHGNSVFIGTNMSSHYARQVEPSNLFEVGPFFVTDDAVGKRCPAPGDKISRTRGVVPGMIGWSLSTDPLLDRLFLLGKTQDLDVVPGAYQLDKKALNQVFSTDFLGIALGYGSGVCNRGDLLYSQWLYQDPIELFPQPFANTTFRVYFRDELDGYVLAARPDQANTALPEAMHYRPEPTDVGAQFFKKVGQGAIAIGPDQGLWVVTKNAATNQVEVERLLRQNWADKSLVQVEAFGATSGVPNTAEGFWRVTHNLGTPADRGASIVEVQIDFATSNNPAHANIVFDTDQSGMVDYFDAGNNNVAGCRGTWRHNSHVDTGLVFDAQNTPPRTPCAAGANTGWIGTNPRQPGEYRTLRFRFAAGQFSNETFAFDCDTDFSAADNGGAMAGLTVRIRLANGVQFEGRLVADPVQPNRSVARFTDQTVKDAFTPNPPLVLGIDEAIEDVEVGWVGDIYLLIVDRPAVVSKLVKFDPVRGTAQVLRTMQERVNDFALYEVLDTAPWPARHPGPLYFVFASQRGRILKWNPVTDTETVMVDGFRFPVTTLAFGRPWRGAGPTSLFLMLGAENPQFAEFYEIGPTDRNGFLEPQQVVSVIPQATRGRGGYAPFLRSEGLPLAGYPREYSIRWTDPDGFGVGGLAGSLALVIGGITQYPGNYYLPDMFVPISMFPVGVVSCIAADPNGPSMVPGAGIGRFVLGAPAGVLGDFVLQAVILNMRPGVSIGNTWTLTNGLRLVF